jgi:ribonuclease P protein component
MDAPHRKLSRLKRSGEFRRVRETGVSFAGKWLVFGVWRAVPPVPQESTVVCAPPRFGVVTSRKVGNAVTRNKVRRRIRHIHLAHLSEMIDGVWCVTVARFRASEATFAQLDSEWCKLARRAGILKT